MQKSVRTILFAALIGGLAWGAWLLFPTPERAIRSRINNIAKTVSFDASDGNVSKGLKISNLLDYFTPDVQIHVEVSGLARHTFDGREELKMGVLWTQSHFRSIQVVIEDINVTLEPDKQSARANLTAQATVSGERDFYLQEFDFFLKKVDGSWKVYRIETVKTLD